MTWWDGAESIAQGGVPVRRRGWVGDAARAGAVVVFVPGSGTRRAVQVFRRGGVEAVMTSEFWRVAEWVADDWEVA